MFENLNKFCEDNRFVLSDHLSFNRYGDGSVSITEVLSVIEDPSFKYLEEKGMLEKAKDRGIRVHKAIEIESYKREDLTAIYYKAHKKWLVINDIEILEKEKTYFKNDLNSGLTIRGTVDVITKQTGMTDYKSSLDKRIKYMLQITGYAWLTGQTKGGILYLGPNGLYQYVEVDIEKYMPIWLELLEYISLLQKVDKQLPKQRRFKDIFAN